MSFQDIANSGLIWGCVVVGIILVVLITLYYMVVCYRHAIKVGVAKETVNAVVKSSATFSIVPSIAIVAGAGHPGGCHRPALRLVQIVSIGFCYIRVDVG